ncbi:hypothetical protein M9Y10_014560 [Tritrichomonas musculus]|uniref:Uncharacterized protein n=1 Tax=Tritrichomonas musculus TaxID=1915356 RepID=A0ABR2KZV5_9EUKA
MSTGIKIGIGVSIGAIAAIIIIGLILLRRHKIQNIPDISDETIEIVEDTTYSIVTQNPLNELMIDDDPFESEFDIYN